MSTTNNIYPTYYHLTQDNFIDLFPRLPIPLDVKANYKLPTTPVREHLHMVSTTEVIDVWVKKNGQLMRHLVPNLGIKQLKNLVQIPGVAKLLQRKTKEIEVFYQMKEDMLGWETKPRFQYTFQHNNLEEGTNLLEDHFTRHNTEARCYIYLLHRYLKQTGSNEGLYGLSRIGDQKIGRKSVHLPVILTKQENQFLGGDMLWYLMDLETHTRILFGDEIVKRFQQSNLHYILTGCNKQTRNHEVIRVAKCVEMSNIISRDIIMLPKWNLEQTYQDERMTVLYNKDFHYNNYNSYHLFQICGTNNMIKQLVEKAKDYTVPEAEYLRNKIYKEVWRPILRKGLKKLISKEYKDWASKQNMLLQPLVNRQSLLTQPLSETIPSAFILTRFPLITKIIHQRGRTILGILDNWSHQDRHLQPTIVVETFSEGSTGPRVTHNYLANLDDYRKKVLQLNDYMVATNFYEICRLLSIYGYRLLSHSDYQLFQSNIRNVIREVTKVNTIENRNFQLFDTATTIDLKSCRHESDRQLEFLVMEVGQLTKTERFYIEKFKFPEITEDKEYVVVMEEEEMPEYEPTQNEEYEMEEDVDQENMED